jgi:two-component system NtrC family sensor kinase
MNKHLQHILDTLLQIEAISEELKSAITKSLKDADKELTILEFKLDRTEKVKRTTAILLEETIDELENKRKAVEETLAELKSTQTQLIQSEKMASLGELTAGIAHEIQNPLNFVNNFSELNRELIEELKEELAAGNTQLVNDIANDIETNEQKINHHGKRAESIVKGMLLHSRGSSGKKEPTDINALADEYLRLSYHGFRAKDKSFNADFKLEADESLPKIEVVPQDIGRVLLNLINNAFYACAERYRSTVNEKDKQNVNDYKPLVVVVTKLLGNKVEIQVQDNGNGIPNSVKEKIFQPFFTTKPTGHGTGLGLSLSYDIVKAHGGKLNVETAEEKGTTFIISLNI